MKSVAFCGPPFVMTKALVKTWKLPTIPITRLKNRTGDKMGREIDQKRCHELAPSISAASSSSAGIFCRPARNITICGPIAHRLIRMKAGLAYGGSNSHLMPVSYTHLRAHETRHDLVCRLLLEK